MSDKEELKAAIKEVLKELADEGRADVQPAPFESVGFSVHKAEKGFVVSVHGAKRHQTIVYTDKAELQRETPATIQRLIDENL